MVFGGIRRKRFIRNEFFKRPWINLAIGVLLFLAALIQAVWTDVFVLAHVLHGFVLLVLAVFFVFLAIFLKRLDSPPVEIE